MTTTAYESRQISDEHRAAARKHATHLIRRSGRHIAEGAMTVYKVGYSVTTLDGTEVAFILGWEWATLAEERAILSDAGYDLLGFNYARAI
ncbi:hypothetical protein [Rhodococcus qingshengii]|uniref:Uncharacterized protein n=1 Tax=Rhodococcus qingshengii TaxID=334542 RepID=A0A2A5IX94_RHOSG|nr:hypothetical protein [Rhodococcus qingshengii]PCK21920.1 hypothetical protein CHR55_33380 [Rhodococcus qingshengii]